MSCRYTPGQWLSTKALCPPPPRRHVAVSGDFLIVTMWREGCYSHLVGGGILQSTKQAPITRNYPTPNVCSVEAEKLCTEEGYRICGLRESLGTALFEKLPTLSNINCQGSSLLAQRSSVGLQYEPERDSIVYFSFHLKQ